MLRLAVVLSCAVLAIASVDTRLHQLQKALQEHGADSPQAVAAVRLFKEEKARERMVAAASVEKPEQVTVTEIPMPVMKATTTLAAVDENPLKSLQEVLKKEGADSAAAINALKRYKSAMHTAKAASTGHVGTSASTVLAAESPELSALQAALEKFGAESPQAAAALKQYKIHTKRVAAESANAAAAAAYTRLTKA